MIVHLIPSLGGGGAERQLAMLASEQVRRGHRVYVGTRRGGVHEATLVANGVVVRRLADRRSLNPLLAREIYAWLGDVKPGVVQTWLAQMDILGGVATLRRGIPWILSERVSEGAFPRFSPMTLIRRWIGRRASAVIANSAAGARYWRGWIAESTPIATISNAVDVAAIRAAPAAEDPDTRKLILVVGRLDRQKGVEVLIAAAARLAARNDFRILIIGQGPLEDELRAQVAQARLDSWVTFSPYRPEWWSVLKTATVLVSMSRFEGQPNVVLEATAAGCPVVVSDIPEHLEFLSGECATVVPLDDVAALASALDSILDDARPVQARARLAERSCEQRTVASAADAYETIYNRVLTGEHF